MSTPPSHIAPRNSGFTLLEVLIAAVLLATLMVGIWSLYRMFATLYETGYLRVEQAQLIRSVTQQLADDLAGTVLPAPKEDRKNRSRSGAANAQDDFDAFAMSGADGVASSADRMGFLGTYDGMRLDVLQSEAPTVSVYDTQDTEYSLGENTVERSAEIVTVIYSFQPPPISDEWVASQPGLKRQEFRLNQSAEFGDWGADDSSMSSSSSSIIESAVEQGDSDELMEPTSEMAGAGGGNRFRISTMYLPEVVAMEFRYYDGKEWADAWDSRIRRALPKAVEVALQVEFDRDTELQISEAEEILPTSDTMEMDEETFDTAEPDLFAEIGESKPPRLPIHRFVIHLPQAIAPPDDDNPDVFDEAEMDDTGFPPLPDDLTDELLP